MAERLNGVFIAVEVDGSVAAKAKGPIPASVDVSNRCVAHPDAK